MTTFFKAECGQEISVASESTRKAWSVEIEAKGGFQWRVVVARKRDRMQYVLWQNEEDFTSIMARPDFKKRPCTTVGKLVKRTSTAESHSL